ncbi:hypothetical protein E2C01_059220 [Portunus trituberculatus]|uniref:Uncharacterized protein n=1 Tax=Portunus trituberculatus TaxID=210409 RepID=A0A5B7H8H2_PORTR|nr:hypothetical protein [Portunus trituberculatus]
MCKETVWEKDEKLPQRKDYPAAGFPLAASPAECACGCVWTAPRLALALPGSRRAALPSSPVLP